MLIMLETVWDIIRIERKDLKFAFPAAKDLFSNLFKTVEINT